MEWLLFLGLLLLASLSFIGIIVGIDAKDYLLVICSSLIVVSSCLLIFTTGEDTESCKPSETIVTIEDTDYCVAWNKVLSWDVIPSQE